MADEATYELAKVDDVTLVHITRIDGLDTDLHFEPFEHGTEEQAIEAFMDDMGELEPDAVEPGDDDAGDLEEDIRTLSFWRP
jgi:hypothetical protein